ncbi:hypothetical protein COLO4_37457 [Corchorus olitorius]|uniref:Uncharacterized protein n=1 Tax=Corchorus olitorius TaxID=93759 RepID=A0A1R3G1M1_9ROSI|nr:hypothetical protein COLO4_37457 [Corchorus olitorius]
MRFQWQLEQIGNMMTGIRCCKCSDRPCNNVVHGLFIVSCS